MLVVNSEYRHNLAQRETEGERDYSSRRKTCEAISKKLGVQWLRDVKWKELGRYVCVWWNILTLDNLGTEEMSRVVRWTS